MSISFEGIGQLHVTFPVDGCVPGQVCTVDAKGTVVSCGEGDAFIGKVQAVEGDKASVIMEGFITVSYTGTMPACGYYLLSADDFGGVQADSSGKEYLVVAVDSAAKTCVIKL